MASGKKSVHFIITGGTIDSYYDGSKDTAVPLKHSVIPGFVKSLKLYHDVAFTEVCMKDSRSLTQADREAVLKAVEASQHDKIIVTHGTYTMPDTARFLKVNLQRKNQAIVLTGSLIPLVGFSPSDAPFNLGFALAKACELKPGIYVCMHGAVFSPEEVVKLVSEGRFTSIFTEEK